MYGDGNKAGGGVNDVAAVFSSLETHAGWWRSVLDGAAMPAGFSRRY